MIFLSDIFDLKITENMLQSIPWNIVCIFRLRTISQSLVW